MAKQTLTFVLLPNGLAPQNKLRLSIYLTPRLDEGATLGAFPDMLTWTSSVAQHGLHFEIASETRKATVSVDRSVLRPDIWGAIFAISNYVEKYSIPAYDQRIFVSYPARDALTYLKYIYQSLGSNNFSGSERVLRDLLQDLVFRAEDGSSTLDDAMSQMRLAIWSEQQGLTAGGGQARKARAMLAAQPSLPDGIATTLSTPTNTRDIITRFALYHHMVPAPNRPPLPETEAEFVKAKTLDFHRALTALNSYPSLLRKLGLVFDVEVPATLCPDSPNAGAYRTVSINKVTAGFKWSITPHFFLPVTAYYRDKKSYSTAPSTPPASLGSKNYTSGDVIDGMLALSADGFNLSEVEVDGALLLALSLADNVANVRDTRFIEDTLSALRSGGISLIADGRALQLLEAIRNNQTFDQAFKSNTTPRPFNAVDLVRGYRIDIWSSQTGQWYSLHRRNSVYGFGATGKISVNVNDEEGFTQLAPAQPADDPTRKPDQFSIDNHLPQPGTDIFVHERVLRWNGWSLSVQRPALPINRSPDPTLATHADPTMGQPLTPFKMTTSFTAVRGSLPELRFGMRYRMRVRAVNLAGNSVALSSATPQELAAPASGVLFPYLRFEPVAPPIVVPRRAPKPGGSLDWLVIRSYNINESLDSEPTSDFDDRHICPPRISALLAEHHGMLDDAQGKLRGDQQLYDEITTRDQFEFPKVGGFPMENAPQLTVGYLPDPFARGAALRNLPGGPDNTNGRLAAGKLNYTTLPDVQPRPGSVTFIDFGANWPARTTFRLAIVEGLAAPTWDSVNRVLTVYLPKSTVVEIPLSCYLNPADLSVMGVWAWLREGFEARQLNAIQNPQAGELLNFGGDLIALFTRLSLEGGHEMLTPARALTLVHAVQQPLRRPVFLQLPVVHNATNPILASALRNLFTPITAWRSYGSHEVVLLGGMEIHGQSSAKIDLEARWLEVTDDPAFPEPVRNPTADHVETISLADLSGGQIPADATNLRYVAMYIPPTDTLWFAAPFDELSGVTTPSEVAAPLHHFADTKHRWVYYTAVAATRFREYFQEKGLTLTRTSEPLLVDVPSSARPLAPEVNCVVPIFGWERQETTNVKTSVRFGYGLRVYLNRPWYSSGLDELLGVVLWPAHDPVNNPSPNPPPDYATREKFKPYLTQWGNDPIWQSGNMKPIPAVTDFPKATATGASLILEETSQTFDVVGHLVSFDQQRGLWYCDIVVQSQSAYTPFLRLALARYQPHSILGVELSKVVLADYAQLTPNRSAFLSIDENAPQRARVAIGGLGPKEPTQNVITVSVEQRRAGINSDLAWDPAPASVVSITEDAPAHSEPNAALWSGTILFTKTPAPSAFRIVIREYELFFADIVAILDLPVERLIYAAVLDYDFPWTQPK
jgi:hypothetical protein